MNRTKFSLSQILRWVLNQLTVSEWNTWMACLGQTGTERTDAVYT